MHLIASSRTEIYFVKFEKKYIYIRLLSSGIMSELAFVY